jgi:hypothetical protein
VSTNRVVILLSPIFVGLAGWVAELCARYLPGHPVLDSKDLTVVFLAGATYAASKILMWLHGSQKDETRKSWSEERAKPAASAANYVLVPAGQTGTGHVVPTTPATSVAANSSLPQPASPPAAPPASPAA